MCPTGLAKLSQLDPAVTRLFVDVKPLAEQRVATQYVRQFSNDMLAWAPNAEEHVRLQGLFPLEFTNSPYQLEHQGRFYLAEQQQQGWTLIKSVPSSISVQRLNKELL